MQFELINIAITGVCLFTLGAYFNYREKKLNSMADRKFLEIREKYLVQIAHRKAKTKAEIQRIKILVEKLEEKHKKMSSQSSKSTLKEDLEQAQQVLKDAEKKARQIEHEAKQKSQKFYDDQKNDVQTKMVDLVMNVTRKVLTKTLTYEDQRELIEKALLEVEGDAQDDD